MVTAGNFSDLKHIGRLAGPLVLTNLLYVAIATIDLAMLGMLSPLDLAAGGLAIAIFNQFVTVGKGLTTATGNLVSYAVGKNEPERITPLLNASLLLGTLIGVLFSVLMLLSEPLLLLLGTVPEVAEKTTAYLSVVAIGVLPCFWFQSVRHFSVGLKAPGPLLMITGISVLLTLILNYGFIFGAFGLPALGFIGIAVATCIVLFLSFLLFLFFIRRHPQLKRYFTWKIWQTDKQALSATWKMGLPVAATYGSEAGFFTVLSLFVATLGVSELAAHMVVMQIVYIVFMVAAGISSAASIYISEAHARENFAHARRIAHLAIGSAVSIMLMIMAVYFMAPHWVLYGFLSADELQNSQVVEIATQLLFIAAFLQIFDAGQNIGVGILRGVGDVKSAFSLSVIGYWCIGLPLAWLMSVEVKLGIEGVWYGLMLGLSVTAISQFWCFNRHINRLSNMPELSTDPQGGNV
ncbi:MATE family efflux transporter [Thalassomonas sp. RHCl1]|uniref:MATE family efflux transporter n=1 Tax=Thalassomonas sp. RHCl1 TaxID=2995320 RepID=UPI00248C47A7|nr:MATE family efflux transporter [Thalassomonas sp. RHCl1]